MNNLYKGYYNDKILLGSNHKKYIDILKYHVKFIKHINHKKFFDLHFTSNDNRDIDLILSMYLLNSNEHKYFGDDYYNLFTIYIYIGNDNKLNDNSIGTLSFAIGKNDIFCFNIQTTSLVKPLYKYYNSINFTNYKKISNKLHRILFYILNYFYKNLNKQNILGFSNDKHICNNNKGFNGNYDNLFKSYGFNFNDNFFDLGGNLLINKSLKDYNININSLNYNLFCLLKDIKKYDNE